ncbi:MAG: transporter [Mycobacteriaceae bacterium]|nr:transporter [Mycobacteriaceae bacterium]
MNSATMTGSLIFATALAVLYLVVTGLMRRGWRRRAQREAGLIGPLPPLPEVLGTQLRAMGGKYLGCTLVRGWPQRIAAGDLGYPDRAVLIGFAEGIMVRRDHTRAIWIPRESITAIRAASALAGKVVTGNAVLAIRWRLPSGVEIDTGFRGNNRSDYADWLQEVA